MFARTFRTHIHGWRRSPGRAVRQPAMGRWCVFLAIIGCLFAAPALAAGLSLASDDGSPLRFVVTNDGVGPAHFKVVSDDGGPVLATLGSGATIVPAQLSLTGELAGDAAFRTFGGFVSYNLESIADMQLQIVSLDGRMVYAALPPWQGNLQRSKNRFFPDVPTRMTFQTHTVGNGLVTDFANDIGIYGPHAAFYPSALTILGFGPAGDIGTILSDGSISSFDLPIRNFIISIGIPEPATWALLLAGFGMAGVALRRRRRVVREA